MGEAGDLPAKVTPPSPSFLLLSRNLGYTVISSPPPGSGAILASILGVMDTYQVNTANTKLATTPPPLAISDGYP